MKLSRFCFICIILLFVPLKAQASIINPPSISYKETKYSSNYIEVNMKIPMINYPNISVERKINSTFEGDIISFKNGIESLAKKAYIDSKKDPFDFIPYEAFQTFKTPLTNSKILSIPVIFYSYTGGAHGITIQESYNFNLETGAKLSLNDLFLENTNYKDTIKDIIKSSIEDNPNIYFDDATSVVDKLSNNQDFYITNEDIIIYYPLYEIAPYSSGIREFPIPISTLSSMLNPKFCLVK